MNKLLMIILILLLTSCLTMTQEEKGEVIDKHITMDSVRVYHGSNSFGWRLEKNYHIITNKGDFIVREDLYKIIDIGEVYYINKFHLDGTPNRYKSSEELYGN